MDYADDRRGDWGDYANNDWQNNWNNNYWYHDDWCHGHWDSGWDNFWDVYPAAAAVGLTAWGVNQMSYLFGYSPYVNPYYVAAPAETTVVYNYSEPLVYQQPAPVIVESTTTVAPTTVAPATAPVESGSAGPMVAPEPSPESLDAFSQARDAFYQNDYGKALQLVDETLKSMPKDASVHEFRALVLFALGKYQEAAATLYAVLDVGPGWDWTTMSSMYPDVETYTTQLRALEDYTKANEGNSPAHFVLAYHYLTAGHKEEAVAQLKKVVELTPENSVAKELLSMLGGPDAVPKPASPPPDAKLGTLAESQLVGDWRASARGSEFEIKLSEDGTFQWTFSQNGKRQEIGGVYALDGNSLALEPDSGGTMLAEVSLKEGNALHFAMVGADPGDPGLDFKR